MTASALGDRCRRPLARRGHRDGGFSLLELMVAVAVMGLALGMLHRLDAGALRGVGDLDRAQRAGMLAQSLLAARETVPETGVAEAGRSAGFDWRVASTPLARPDGVAAAAPLLHELRIDIAWAGRQGVQSLTLRTLLPQALPPPPGAAAAPGATR